MPPPDDTIREIAKALRHHVEAVTLEKIVNELLDVPGNKSFRDAIEAAGARVDAALRLIASAKSAVAGGVFLFLL